MNTRESLLQRGIKRMHGFCAANELPFIAVTAVPQADWPFAGVCAYWRPNYIHICVPMCAQPAPVYPCRNWNWPGSTTDREPYGVIAHELGHLADWTEGKRRGLRLGEYSSELCQITRKASGEKPLTSYCPNDAEWFAEHFRLFVTNHALLELLRPRTHALFMEIWTPVSCDDWLTELGEDVPERIVRALENKMPKVRK